MVDGFISPDICGEFTRYLDYKLDHDTLYSHENCNPQFSNTLVQSHDIRNSRIQALMLDIIDRKRQLITREFITPLAKADPARYKGVVLHHDSTDIVRWKTGASLGEHADNQFWNNLNANHYSAHRDWSSVLYLNDGFQGGDFYFRNPRIKVHPKPGRLVVFGAGIDYIHGVEAVTAGSRYTLPSWWTYGNRPENPMRCRGDGSGDRVVKNSSSLSSSSSSS